MKHLGNIPFCMLIVRTFSILKSERIRKKIIPYIFPLHKVPTKYEVYFIQILKYCRYKNSLLPKF